MDHDTLAPSELRARLTKEIKDAKFGMLGLVGPGEVHHFQPMTCEVADSGEIYFFSRKETELAKAAAAGGHDVMLTIMSKGQDFQACLHGHLIVSDNRNLIEAFWSPFIGAWFPEGKNDPALTLLKFEGRDARVWLSRKGPVSYLYEVAKANVTKGLPDVGRSADLTL
jgi:general stress protein 26